MSREDWSKYIGVKNIENKKHSIQKEYDPEYADSISAMEDIFSSTKTTDDEDADESTHPRTH